MRGGVDFEAAGVPTALQPDGAQQPDEILRRGARWRHDKARELAVAVAAEASELLWLGGVTPQHPVGRTMGACGAAVVPVRLNARSSMNHLLLLAALAIAVSACQPVCGEMVLTGTELDLVDPGRDEVYSYDRSYDLKCYSGRSEWGRPAHTVAYFPDGLFTAPRPLMALTFWETLRDDGADWALTTGINSWIYLEPDRIQEGAVLTVGDGIVHGQVDFFKELAPPRYFEDGAGNRGDAIDFTMSSIDGEVRIEKLVQTGADCGNDGEGWNSGFAEVRWKVGYDLSLGPGPSGPAGSEVRLTGESWFLYDYGKVNDPELYEEMAWWCARQQGER